MFTKELIAAAIQKAPQTEPIPQWLAKELARLQALRETLREKRRDRQMACERHKAEMAELEAAERAIQSQCPHYETTYHADPAGGSDSHTVCNLCGKWW